MVKRNMLFALLLASAMAATTGAAFAGSITIGPGGVRVDPGFSDNNNDQHRHHRRHMGISQEEAIDIAHHNGVRHVESVDMDRGDFEVSGRDRHRHFISVTIDGDTGGVINVERG